MSFHELMRRLELPADQLERDRDALTEEMASWARLGLSMPEIKALVWERHRRSMAEIDADNPRMAESLLEPTERVIRESLAMLEAALEAAT